MAIQLPRKFRASYTILQKWADGKWQEAVEQYFKLKPPVVTPQMEEGKRYHQSWEADILQLKQLPPVFGNYDLINPQAEVKIVVPMYSWLELVGVIDCLDVPTIHEFKTGKRTSEEYANSMQPAVYGVLATLAGHFVNQAVIHRYDQYNKKTDVSFVWLTDSYLRQGQNWIETLAAEMHNYFLEYNLYSKFGREVS